MDHTDPSPKPAAPDAHGQQHSISVYLKIWGLLFVLSTLSYLVDYFRVEGLTRWVLIVALMIAKAGLIVWVFMELRRESGLTRLAALTGLMFLALLIGLAGLDVWIRR